MPDSRTLPALMPDDGQAACMSDEAALACFVHAQQVKLYRKRRQGYGGWDDETKCSVADLRRLLTEHIEKGDMVDIANFAMMIWNRERWDSIKDSAYFQGGEYAR